MASKFKFLIMALVLICGNAEAALIPTAPFLQVGPGVSGGVYATFTDLTNLIMGSAYTTSASNRYSTLRKQGSSSSYAVTALKTFTVRAIEVVAYSAVGSQYTIGYCDNDVGYNGSTAPTNAVYNRGAAAQIDGQASAAGGGGHTVQIFNFQVPAGKYPFIDSQGASATDGYVVYGYEN